MAGTSEDWEALPRACAPSHRKKRGGLLAAVLISHPSFLVLESLNETLAEPPAACAIGYSRARTTSSGSGPQASFFYCLPVTPLPSGVLPLLLTEKGALLLQVMDDGAGTSSEPEKKSYESSISAKKIALRPQLLFSYSLGPRVLEKSKRQ